MRFAAIIVFFSLLGPTAYAQTVQQQNPGNYIAILGQVTYPGVYEFTENTLSLQRLLSEARGVTSSAAGQVRIIRNGFNSKPISLNKSDQVRLLSGDVVIVDSLLKLNGLQLSISPAKPPVADPQSEEIQLCFLNLLNRPVVVKTPINTIQELLYTLGQNKDLIASIRVITPPATLRGRPLSHLPSSSVLVFDRRFINAAAIPEMPEAFKIIPRRQPVVKKVPAPESVEKVLKSQGLVANRDSKPIMTGDQAPNSTTAVQAPAKPLTQSQDNKTTTQSAQPDTISTAVAAADENELWHDAGAPEKELALAPAPPAEEPYFVEDPFDAMAGNTAAGLAMRNKSRIQAILPEINTDGQARDAGKRSTASPQFVVTIIFLLGLGISARILWSMATHPAVQTQQAKVPEFHHDQQLRKHTESNLSTLIKQELPIETEQARFETNLVFHSPVHETGAVNEKLGYADLNPASKAVSNSTPTGTADERSVNSTGEEQSRKQDQIPMESDQQSNERLHYMPEDERKIMIDPAHPGVIGKTTARENTLRLLDRVLSQVHQSNK